jgi:excisionase family DNA binding protein
MPFVRMLPFQQSHSRRLSIRSTKILDAFGYRNVRFGLKAYMLDTNSSSRPSRELQWLTAAEAATYLRIKPRTLLHWVRTGKVRGFALSGTERRIWRFLIADLDAALLKETVLGSKTLSVSAEREEQ